VSSGLHKTRVLSACWRDVSVEFWTASVVEPTDEIERSQFDFTLGFPRAVPAEHFSFVMTVKRLNQRIVVRADDAAH
jgi:hypothetical protein